MKKFLFTLAMLLMAGSAFADNYLYMDDIVLTKNFVEQSGNKARQINVPVKAHFEQWTNAFDVTFDYGTIECRGVATQTVDGEEVPITPDMVLKGMNKNGVMVNTTVALNSNADANHFIAANSVGGYYYPEGSDPENDDPVQYGAVKWAPGDYECMFMLILRIPQHFEGGDITVSSKFASGADTRPNVEVVPAEYANTPTVKVAHVSVIDNTPAISDDGEKVTAVFNGATTNVELYLKNGEEWVKVDNPYTLPEATDVDQVLVFKAKTVPAEGAEGQLPAESEEYTVTIKAATPELQPAPKPTITDDGTKVTAAIAGDTQHTYVLELWNAETETWGEVDNPYNLPAATFETQVLKFRAKTKAIEGVDSEDSEYCAEYTVTIPAKEKDYAPTPTITKIENGTKVEATVEGNYEVVLMLEGEDGVYAPCANPYTLPENTSYTDDIVLNFKAYTKKNGEYYDSPETEVFTVTIPHKTMDQAVKPKITFTPDNGGVTVKIEDYTEYTIKVNGTQVDPTRNEHNYYVEKGDVDKEIVVYAKNAPENMIEADTTATYLLAAKKVYEVADPTITVDDSDPTKTVITIKATEGDLTYTLTDEDGNVIPASDYTVAATENGVVITIENGEEVKTVNVTATTTMTVAPEGYDEVKNGEAKKTVQTPVYVQPQTAKPTIDVSFAGEEGHYYANVTFKNGEADPNAVIEYCLGDPNVEENWMTYTGAPVVITEDGTHTVYARATATGKATSEVAKRDFELNQTATSVNELVNGKTVAGVRYFNMAGQEMQEANGVTIVVTTYTDGTTSAVKVIK